MNIETCTSAALEAMKAKGFDAAQVSGSMAAQDEVYIGANEASMLRSTESHKLALTGIIDGRKASTELSDLSDAAVAEAIQGLYENALLAPQDEANAVSENQSITYSAGPQECDLDVLTQKVAELLDFRREQTPKITMDEGGASHSLVHTRILTSEGSCLDSTVGSYSLLAFGTATEGDKSSSLAYAGGSCHDLSAAHATSYFGIEEMLRTTENQIHTQSIAENFTGDVVLTPAAASDLLNWLVGQLGDMQLLSGSSVFADQIGQIIASERLSIHSKFDAPGLAPVSGDGFVTAPLTLVDGGRLTTLLPSLYGSRKTGYQHCPSGGGWRIAPGDTPRDDIAGTIGHGAWVGRLSMGRPAANGDFSGVIKSSFEIVDGELGAPLAEVMISGNMADMLRNISAISSETLDTGSEDLPWIRIGGLHFS